MGTLFKSLKNIEINQAENKLRSLEIELAESNNSWEKKELEMEIESLKIKIAERQ